MAQIIWDIFLNPEFDLTFQKWFVSLSNKNGCKTDVKCWQTYLGDKENF